MVSHGQSSNSTMQKQRRPLLSFKKKFLQKTAAQLDVCCFKARIKQTTFKKPMWESNQHPCVPHKCSTVWANRLLKFTTTTSKSKILTDPKHKSLPASLAIWIERFRLSTFKIQAHEAVNPRVVPAMRKAFAWAPVFSNLVRQRSNQSLVIPTLSNVSTEAMQKP